MYSPVTWYDFAIFVFFLFIAFLAHSLHFHSIVFVSLLFWHSSPHSYVVAVVVFVPSSSWMAQRDCETFLHFCYMFRTHIRTQYICKCISMFNAHMLYIWRERAERVLYLKQKRNDDDDDDVLFAWHWRAELANIILSCKSQLCEVFREKKKTENESASHDCILPPSAIIASRSKSAPSILCSNIINQ